MANPMFTIASVHLQTLIAGLHLWAIEQEKSGDEIGAEHTDSLRDLIQEAADVGGYLMAINPACNRDV